MTSHPPNIYNLYGCLIDLDYAVDTHIAGASGAADRTGTYPFIAINVLSAQEVHRYRYDLESFLYVLLWVSCYPVPTRTAPSPSPDEVWPAHDPLGLWRDGTIDQVASDKARKVVAQVDTFNSLLERFRPVFEAFKQASRELRMILWATPAGLCALIPEKGSGDPAARDGLVAAQGEKEWEEEVEEEEEKEEVAEGDVPEETQREGQVEVEGQGYNLHDNRFDSADAVSGLTNDAPNLTSEQSWRLDPKEVRIGVSNLEAFRQVIRVFVQLNSRLKPQAGNDKGPKSGASHQGRGQCRKNPE